jgi:hypothetical protein
VDAQKFVELKQLLERLRAASLLGLSMDLQAKSN